MGKIITKFVVKKQSLSAQSKKKYSCEKKVGKNNTSATKCKKRIWCYAILLLHFSLFYPHSLHCSISGISSVLFNCSLSYQKLMIILNLRDNVKLVTF
jgi:hypothetical protein